MKKWLKDCPRPLRYGIYFGLGHLLLYWIIYEVGIDCQGHMCALVGAVGLGILESPWWYTAAIFVDMNGIFSSYHHQFRHLMLLPTIGTIFYFGLGGFVGFIIDKNEKEI